jgi:oligosaccharyltransferase complex subunit delta (ribophorin II)
LGVNVSAFPFTLPALGFHVGLAAIFGLYYMFWLEFNMFTTVKYLIMIGVVTFLCGNSMLSGLAEKRKAAQ